MAEGTRSKVKAIDILLQESNQQQQPVVTHTQKRQMNDDKNTHMSRSSHHSDTDSNIILNNHNSDNQLQPLNNEISPKAASRATSVKSSEDYSKLNLYTFYGTKYDNIRLWLDKFRMECSRQQIKQKEWIHCVTSYLGGYAYKWFEQNEYDIYDWTEFEIMLLSKFDNIQLQQQLSSTSVQHIDPNNILQQPVLCTKVASPLTKLHAPQTSTYVPSDNTLEKKHIRQEHQRYQSPNMNDNEMESDWISDYRPAELRKFESDLRLSDIRQQINDISMFSAEPHQNLVIWLHEVEQPLNLAQITDQTKYEKVISKLGGETKIWF
ncbi:unnamed protein product [Didymodactylos carnosus]|uniref:Retrotransposon gag domain-containing protein n=1 Tax=Didymodactylos carnosus TaxID=1234261 RepID=A0A815J6B3_9BILA|nr:unnamed protein product [Didymodactylos carnosus]CAF4266910.1 unnamed protein product [Didymodactylos carnosus]